MLYWKRHNHPLNIGLLSLFTVLEAFTLGVVTAFYDNVIVMQALLITTGVFLGLTLFTLQSKVSFSPAVLRSGSDVRLLSMTSQDSGHGCSVVLLLYVCTYHPVMHCYANQPLSVMTGLVGVFLPFSRTMDLVFAIGGTLLFSGYVVYDTYVINSRLSPDEYIMGAISLYLE